MLRARNDDAALVRRLQTGDERAFEEIFKRHRAPLLSYCRHMLCNRDEGEDALQQTFVKAHRSLLGGTTPRELRPWLYAIARNCCLTAIASRRGWVGIESPLDERAPSLAGLSEEVSRREDLRELVAGIGRLPEDQRSALLLAELDDLPHAAIAAIVGCEVSKVKALVYQARSALLADRDALGTPCLEIREQLSVARGGELRRGPLRRHLRLCAGCRDFQLALSAQRQSLAAVLPVAPSAGLAVAVLGHGAAAHTAAAAGIGHASGTAATTTAVGAGAGASAGLVPAPAGTGIGALLGGGLATKLAVGGAVVVLAAAGAATVHNREGRAIAHDPTRVQLFASGTAGRSVTATDFAGSNSLRPSSSSSSLALSDWTPPLGAAGSTDSKPLPALSASLSQPVPSTPQSKGSEHSSLGTNTPASKRHRTAPRRKQARLRRKERAAARRARRKALEHKPRVVKAPKPKPVAKPTPAPGSPRTHHHKARPAPESTPVQSSTPTETTTSTGSESKETSGEETTSGTHPKPHTKKHLIESEPEQPSKAERQTKNKVAQPTNLRGEPEVTDVDVHPHATQNSTGGTHDASS